MSATEESQIQTTATAAPANKLYVGNIEYSTTKEELKDLFKEYPIQGLEIPTRQGRGKNFKEPKTKGYVFITFQPEVTDLDAIIEKFTDQEFKGRKIYLRHVVKKPEPEASVDDSTKEKGNGENSKVNKPSKKFAKPAQKEKIKIPFDQGTPSTDTIHIKNLDFATTPKELKEFFEQQGEKPKWVSIPVKRIPGYILFNLKKNNKPIEKRNYGYAFVRLNIGEDEDLNSKISKLQDLKFKDRELKISVAVDVREAEEAAVVAANETAEKEEESQSK